MQALSELGLFAWLALGGITGATVFEAVRWSARRQVRKEFESEGLPPPGGDATR